MPHTREYYQKQKELALREAERAGTDRGGWLRIAQEWQRLLDCLDERHVESPSIHLLDS